MGSDEQRQPHWYELEDGGRLAYLEFGDPDGPVALVAPGLTDGLAPVFHEPAAAEVGEPPKPFDRYRVLVVSHRRPVQPGWSTAAMADDLAAFIEAEVEPPVTLVGHSMGGMIGQFLAARHPDLVERLVLSSTMARPDTVFTRRLERWEGLLRGGRWYDFHRDAIDASFTGPARLRQRASLRRSETEAPPEELVDRHLALSTACKQHDATGVLADIGQPTLVLTGRHDSLVRSALVRELAEGLPDATLVVVDRAGHALPEQRPRAYARALRSFLEGT